jgi:hypothetical protein
MEAVLLAILPRHATYGLDEAQLHTLLRRLQQQGDSPGAARS